jgi:hypothetical protein
MVLLSRRRTEHQHSAWEMTLGQVMTKPSPTLRIYLLTLLQYLVPGAGLAALAFIVSLFQTGMRAEYTRLVALGAFLVMLAVALLRVAWLFVASRSNR